VKPGTHPWAEVPILGALALGCSVPVAANLDEGDANQSVLLLEKNGVGADKERDPEHEGRFRVNVARGESSLAIGVLAAENMPPRTSPGVLEALGEGGVVPSRLAEHAKWTAGVAGDLERSLRSVDGVLSARVHLAVPPKELLPGTTEPDKPSASVLVRHRGATPPLATADVQQLVAGAVSGLSPAQVTVVLATSPTPRATDRELLRFGPLTVTRGSLLPLRLVAGGVILLNLILAGVVIGLFRRLRRTELLLDEAGVAPR
jgi:type III secretion protein J